MRWTLRRLCWTRAFTRRLPNFRCSFPSVCSSSRLSLKRRKWWIDSSTRWSKSGKRRKQTLNRSRVHRIRRRSVVSTTSRRRGSWTSSGTPARPQISGTAAWISASRPSVFGWSCGTSGVSRLCDGDVFARPGAVIHGFSRIISCSPVCRTFGEPGPENTVG